MSGADTSGRPVAVGPVAVGLGVLALGLCAWEGTIVQSAAASHWSVLAVIAVFLGTAAAAGRGRQRAPSGAWVRHGARTAWGELTGTDRRSLASALGIVVWAVLVAAVVGWDLNSFVHQAHDLPTLSRLAGDVTRHQWGRALMFAVWLALGGYLAVGGRRRAGTEQDPGAP